ncbi:MAG: hypothetical protein IPM64_15740 [Phycisphaerales bacterium]|nr:hypothetical protein [Phycisphaerales bacterium]
MSTLTGIPPESLLSEGADAQRDLLAPLRAVRARLRAYVVIGAVLQLLLAVLAACLLQFLLDRWLRFTVDQRAFLNGTITIFWLWVLHRYLVLPLERPLPVDLLARWIDARHPELHENITIAVQLAQGQSGDQRSNSPDLIRAVVRDACSAARRISFMSVLDHRRARRQGWLLALVVGLTAASTAVPVVAETLRTWFARNWMLQDVPWPQRTYITPVIPEGIESGRRSVPIGDELRIVARIDGEPSDTATLHWWTAGGRHGAEPMTRRGGQRWEVSLGVLTESVHFRIVGGDERTREYLVDAVERPHVHRTVARITPPAYTGLPPAVLEQQTVLDVLRGASVEIEAGTNRPIAEARFVGPDDFSIPCELLAPDRLLARLHTVAPEPAASDAPPLLIPGVYRFELRDAEGLTDSRPVRFTIKVVADRPPTVELRAEAVGAMVTPLAEVQVELRAEDAYGLAAVALKAQRGEGEPTAISLPEADLLERDYRGTTLISIAALGAVPPERVRILAEATDRDPATNVGVAPPLELRVVTAEEFLSEMARREMELRREFERLVSEQRVYGDALERVLTTIGDESAQNAVRQQLSALARRQNTQASRCVAMRRQFAQILAELRTSRVLRSAEERRLGELIIEPLGELGELLIPQAAGAVAGLRGEGGAERVALVRAQQAEIVRKMQALLANMLEWEGYREALALLREIIAVQGEVREDTLRAIEAQLDAILGDPAEPADKSVQP